MISNKIIFMHGSKDESEILLLNLPCQVLYSIVLSIGYFKKFEELRILAFNITPFMIAGS